MAVFTQVSFADAAALLSQLGAGELERLTAISSGVENTNYFADTTERQLVITLFERLSRRELPFYLELMRHLAQRGLPVPSPLAAVSGEFVHTLAGKPSAVTPRLPGTSHSAPNDRQRQAVATTLAQLHSQGRDYARSQPNPRGLSYWQENAPWLAHHLPQASRQLLMTELEHQEQLAASNAYAMLPSGAIHGDLFRDNVLFAGDQLTGLLDFYFAATDSFAFDIAVCLNDWCTTTDGSLIDAQATAFVSAYESQRKLEPCERELLPELLRAAALRFWVTRLVDLQKPRDARLLRAHDPEQFERILRARIQRP